MKNFFYRCGICLSLIVFDFAVAQANEIRPSIAAGGWFNIFLDNAGEVWSCGCNNLGQLGLGDNFNRSTPCRIPLPEGAAPIVFIAAGNWHTILVGQDGRVWAFGANRHGQLGLGDNVDRNTPCQIEGIPPIIFASAGGWHSILVDENGKVWAFGFNRSGQLGFGDNVERNEPCQIPSKEIAPPAFVATGSEHTILVDKEGGVLVCGSNESGKLGLGFWQGFLANQKKPKKIVFGEDAFIAFAAAGSSHTILQGAGQTWVFGENFNGQLGTWSLLGWLMGHGIATQRYTPRKLDFNNSSPVRFVVAGGWHSVLVCQNGEVWVFGSNKYGQLGLGDTTKRETPCKASLNEAAPIVWADAGFGHTILVDQEGSVWGCGSNGNDYWVYGYGQLGFKDRCNVLSFAKIALPFELKPFILPPIINPKSSRSAI